MVMNFIIVATFCGHQAWLFHVSLHSPKGMQAFANGLWQKVPHPPRGPP